MKMKVIARMEFEPAQHVIIQQVNCYTGGNPSPESDLLLHYHYFYVNSILFRILYIGLIYLF